MNRIQPTYDNRVRYTLRNSLFRPLTISEPEGWNDDEKVFKRSLTAHGVFINLSSNNLKFYRGDANNNGGLDFITGVYDLQGINADILLIKEERDTQTDKWGEAYRGFLDLSTLSVQNNRASVKFNESGLYTAIKARRNEKLDLSRLDTIDGADSPKVSTETVALDGRNILLVSQLELNTTQQNPYSAASSFSAIAFPFIVLGVSDLSVQTITDVVVNEQTSSYGDGVTGNMFYSVAKSDKTLILNIDIKYSWTSALTSSIKLNLVKYENGEDYNFKGFQPLAEVLLTDVGSIYFQDTLEVKLLEGESLAIVSHSDSASNVNYTWETTNMLIEENSFVDSSQAEFVLPFEGLEKIIHVISGHENALKSTLLGRTDLGANVDGLGSLTGLVSGAMVRRLQTRFMQTSFKDFDTSFSTIWDSGYGIEKEGFKEFVRFEERKYFYQKVVTIRLPNQVKNMKRTVAKDYFFSGIDLGYRKPSDGNLYEEAMGLDEYNTKNTFTTIIKRIEKVFRKISVYRADSYGMEFARRKSILTNPEEDTRYDNDIFVMDLKRGATDVFQQRLWFDDNGPNDFEKAPTGVFSPATAQNLRFSPMNLLKRFGWWISIGLIKYPDSEVKFSSSIGNSDLATQLIGQDELFENGGIKVSDLEKPFLLPEILEFEHEATTEILKQVQGKTLINGEMVMNYYGQIEIINENNQKESVHLLELKPNKEGKWKAISANKPISRAKIT
jgi:hypothetical protein